MNSAADRKYVKRAGSKLEMIFKKEKAVELYIKNQLYMDPQYIEPKRYREIKNTVKYIRKLKS